MIIKKMPSIDLMAHISISHFHGLSFRQIESILNIPKSTAQRWYAYCHDFITNSNESKVIIDKITKYKKSTETNITNTNISILNYIKKSLSIQPFQTIRILQNKIHKIFNINITEKNISHYIKLSGFSKKKITKRIYNIKNLKEHKLIRKKFKTKVKKLIKKKKKIICLDESGINRNLYSSSGYCKLNRRLVAYYNMKQLIQKNNSLLMAIDNDKIIKYKLQEQSFNGSSFEEFIKELINDNNLRDTYLLMDNVAFHKKAIKIIQDTGNHVLFIPPYSPDLNPIEEVFSSIKTYIKTYITPLHDRPNINKIINFYIEEKRKLSGYYRHAFGIAYNDE
jgi:transposase